MAAFDSSTARSYLQSSIAGEKMPKAYGKKLENAVTLYVLESGIPHAHVDSRSFRSFVAVSCPGYDVKSSRAVKRRILQTYAVLKRIVVNTFRKTVDSNFSITFDGWSNRNLQGFYAMMIHVFADGKAQDALLDFFCVTPGRQISKRCAEHILEVLDEFRISSRLIATVCDNGSDAIVCGKIIGESLRHIFGRDVLPEDHQCLCAVHCMQIGIKKAFEVILPTVQKLRSCTSKLHQGKMKREVFRNISKAIYGQKNEPSGLECPTRWNSAFHVLMR
jgi:hypothetical protein